MPSFLPWLNANWQFICGLFTVLYVIYILAKFFAEIVIKISSVVKRFETAESTLVTVATNHLPHLQWEIEKTNEIMKSMDDTLKKIYAYHTGDYVE